LQRLVAIKVIPLSGAGEAEVIARFHQEGLLAARVVHPNLVVAYDAGAVAGFPYFVMEFVDGAGLDELVMEGGPLPVAEACEVVRQAALGLQHIHEQGLVHRDVKPSNLMLTPSGQVKVLDLGLARILNEPARGSRITSHGQFLGTLDYVSPEQCDDSHAVDIRADIYSLGCTLYHLLVGQPPFGAPAYESPLLKMKAHAEVPVPPIRERRHEVPEALAAVLARMLAKDRNRRYALPGDVVALLQPFAVGADLERLLLQNRQPVSSCFPDLPKDEARLSTVRGVTDTEIRLGLSAPFSGSARELGRGVELGIRTYLRYLNDRGGIAGRAVSLIALDDGYDPDRALANMRELYERHQVFGVLCNVGTPTAEKTLPYAREKKLLYFGAFTGADLLRKTPPDPYVFNYRPSLEEETAASLKHLLGAERVHPDQVAVFAQEDAFGDAVFQGVAKKLRQCGRNPEGILRVGYIRNSIEVTGAVEEVLRHPEIRAIHMAAVYRPAAQFILKVKGARPNMLFTSVMFVGSEALAEELQHFGPEYAAGVMVTQVVPPADSQATAVLQFTERLGNFYPHERPSSVSLEGYIAAGILAEGLRLAGRKLTTDSVVDALESIHNLDLGIGTPIHFSPSEHQGSHKVWLTVIANQ
jgi:ABC-type branched-subunit amino acid transport system substrate-binding protein